LYFLLPEPKKRKLENASNSLQKVTQESVGYWALRNELLMKEHQAKMDYIYHKKEWKKQRHEAKMAKLQVTNVCYQPPSAQSASLNSESLFPSAAPTVPSRSPFQSFTSLLRM
jgi:hypothetical protein